MVRPIHNGGGVTHHGPRVHFSPVVSQLRYKEQQGCLRPVRRRNFDTNSAVSNDSNKEGGGRVRVHEIILPCPTVQKVETQEQEQQRLSVNSELTTSSQQLKRMEVNGHNNRIDLSQKKIELGRRIDLGQNSIELGCSSVDFDRSNRIDFGHSIELDQSALNCHSQSDYGRNHKRVSSANGLHCEFADHVPDVSSYGTALPLRTSDSINRNARTVYGYEYYGYTYGLPAPASIQRTSLPFHEPLTSDICNLNGRYSCCSSASSASQQQQQQVRQQRQARDASLAANVVVECSECDFLAAQSFNASLPCCPEKRKESKELVADNNPKRKSKKFNFLHKLSFRKLTSSSGQSSWKKSKKASRSASDASQVVSLSSWPSIKGVVVSSNNTLDSPVLTSCTTCAELCHSGSSRRNKSKARNVTPVHLSSASSSSSSSKGADKANRCEELNGIRNGVNGAVYFPVEDNNCLYTHQPEESLAVKSKSEPSRTSVICGDNSSPAVPTWDIRSFNRRHHQHRRQEDTNETIVPAAEDTSISQQISLSSPSKPKNIQTNAHERKVPGSTVEPRRISSSSFDKICDAHDSVRTSKNVATSPIHHLSAFHALNLPVIHKLGTYRKEDGESSSFEPAPTPPPRPRRKRSNASLNQQPDQDSLGNTDELSANVDKILDEIANLELEYLSMELYANLMGGGSRDHLDEGSHSQMKSASKRAERVDRMEFGDEEEGGGRQEAAEWSEETVKRSSSSSISPFGKPPLPPSAGRQNTSAIRQQFLTEDFTTGKEGVDMTGRGTDLDVKLLKFRLQLYRSREELAKSHPNLEEMEDLVRSSMVIDRSRSQRTTLPLSVYDGGSLSSRSGKPEIPPATPLHTATHISSSSSSSPPGQFLEQQEYYRLTPDPVTSEKERCRAEEWSRLVSQINRRNSSNSKSTSCGDHNGNAAGQAQYSAVVETDLDTGTSREIVDGRTSERQLYLQTYGHEQYDDEWSDDVFQQRQQHENQVNDGESRNRSKRKSRNLPLSVYPDHDGQLSYSLNEKTRSLLNLGSPTMSSHREKSATLTPMSSAQGAAECSLSVTTASDERARSMEFLLENSDKNEHLRPPENKLMMRQENRQLSEHEVRIQKSLNKLNVPDWYQKYAESGGGGGTSGGGVSGGGASGSKSKIFGSGTGLAGGWTGLSSSKTSSLTSLQSTGRYSGRTHFSRLRSTGTASTGGRSSRESLMSPSSTASASPSPYYERSSFTYGMPYALTRFASARMSCGASPASLSPSPSPVGGTGGSSTSTPVSSVPLSRHHSYSKTPYLGWRSQERLNTKQMYRTPAERLAADLLAQKSRTSSPTLTVSSVASGSTTKDEDRLLNTSKESSPKKETASASDLSLNNSEESNSHKLNRVRSSIKAVSNAIVDYVNETKPLDDGMNGGTSPRRGFVWLETAFVGTKPIDSPGTPDTPTVIMTSSRQLTGTDSGSSSTIGGGTRPRNVFRFEDDHHPRHHSSSQSSRTAPAATAASSTSYNNDSSLSKSAAKNNGTSTTTTTAATASTYNPYHSRNEQMEERSNSSVSSPTLDDILDSLLALRRPNKKIKPRGHVRDPAPLPPCQLDPTPVSDWQERMNQPVLDVLYFPVTDDFFPGTTTTTIVQSSQPNTSANDYHRNSFNMTSGSTTVTTTHGYNDSNNVTSNEDAGQALSSRTDNEPSNYMSNSIISKADNSRQAEEEKVLAENKSNSQLESLELSGNIKSVELEEDPMENDDEDAFGIPTEICTATASSISSAAVNAIASLNDSNPPTPARHRRVSFDLDVSDKDEKSSSRSNRRDESVGGAIHCRNSKCTKTANGLEARREFKTCHNCNAYYCSRECRRAHWEKHKKVCMQSRVGALCKQIINHVKEDSFVVSQLSGVARRGFLAKGRGCVKLFFSSPDRAERFLTGGLPELPEPWYIPCGDILPEEMGAQIFAELSDQCRTYNGDNRFVIYVSVCVVNEVPTSGAVKWEREMISRSAKLRLLLPRNYEETQMHHQAASPAHLFPDEPVVPALSPDKSSENVPPPPPPHGSDNDTLILRSVPAPTTRQLTSTEDQRLREVSFANIQKQLVERGVDLKRTFPEIYNKLCNYVEYDEPFLPVTIYPKNNKTGRQFVCVIMPDPSSNHHAHEDYTTTTPGSSSNPNVETVNISVSSYELT